MIDTGKREPHDDKTPEEVIAHVIREWEDDWQPGMKMRPLAACIVEALVYKAYFEEAEGALRWLDPVPTEGDDILTRIGITGSGDPS